MLLNQNVFIILYKFSMVKLVILLLTRPFIEFDCSRYQCSSERWFFYLEK